MGVEGNGGEDWGQKQVGSSDKTQEAQGPAWSSPAPSPALAPQSAGLPFVASPRGHCGCPAATATGEGELASHISGLIFSASSEGLERTPEEQSPEGQSFGDELAQAYKGLLLPQNLGSSLPPWSCPEGQAVGG